MNDVALSIQTRARIIVRDLFCKEQPRLFFIAHCDPLYMCHEHKSIITLPALITRATLMQARILMMHHYLANRHPDLLVDVGLPIHYHVITDDADDWYQNPCYEPHFWAMTYLTETYPTIRAILETANAQG